MIFVAKLFRALFCWYFIFSNTCRKLYLKILYPQIKIDKKTVIEKNCKIICVDGGKLVITDSHIATGTHIFCDEKGFVNITGAFIGRNCVIVAKENIEIKQGAAIAEMVVLRDQDHAIDKNDKETGFSTYITQPIVIQERAWIASKATILKGVTVGIQSIIAASAVVTKDVPSNEVWGGIPAKFIKKVN